MSISRKHRTTRNGTGTKYPAMPNSKIRANLEWIPEGLVCCWGKGRDDRFLIKYPGFILLCDCTFILDIFQEQAIKDTNSLHEVRSVATVVPTCQPTSQLT